MSDVIVTSILSAGACLLLRLRLFHVLEHLVKDEGQKFIVCGQELDKLLLFNLRELFNLLLRASLDSVDIDIQKTVVVDI